MNPHDNDSQDSLASEISAARKILARLCEEGHVRMSIPVRADDEDMILKAVIDHAALATPAAAAEPSEKQQKLLTLADRIDYERLWSRPAMTHRDMTPDQRDRMNAGVELRRYARIWLSERWTIVPPSGPVQFSAESLDAAIRMAKKEEARIATPAAAAEPSTEEKS